MLRNWCTSVLILLAAGLVQAASAQDSLNIRMIGRLDGLNVEAMQIVVRDGIAYLAAYSNEGAFGSPGLYLIDVSEPEHPRSVARPEEQEQGLPFGVTLAGNLAITACRTGGFHGGIHIFDITDPPNARELSYFDTDERAYRVVARNDLAYFANNSHGLAIVDIRDAISPQLIGRRYLDHNAWGVALVGDYAFLSLANGGGIAVVDVSDPANLRYVGHGPNDQRPWDIQIRGDYLFAGNNGIDVYDIANPESPNLVSHFGDGFSPYSNIVIRGDRLLFSAGGLHIFDIADPLNPRELGFYDVPNSYGIGVWDTYAILSAVDTIYTFDCSEVLGEIGQGEILVDPDTLQFGELVPGDTARRAVQIRTRGDNPQGISFFADVSGFQSPFRFEMPQAAEPQAYLDSISIACDRYRQRNGVDPADLQDLTGGGFLTLPDNLRREWSYSLLANPVLFIQGSSTDSARIGPGWPILLDRTTGEHFGWGVTYAYWKMDVPQRYNLPIVFKPKPEGEVEGDLTIRFSNVGDSVVREERHVVLRGSSPLGIGSHEKSQVHAFGLTASYPNPFNSTTRIAFEVGVAGWTQMDIMDANGRLVERLVDGVMPAGPREVVWDASGRPAGVYLARLSSATDIRSEPLILMK